MLQPRATGLKGLLALEYDRLFMVAHGFWRRLAISNGVTGEALFKLGEMSFRCAHELPAILCHDGFSAQRFNVWYHNCTKVPYSRLRIFPCLWASFLKLKPWAPI